MLNANYFKGELDALLPTGNTKSLEIRKRRWINYWDYVSASYCGTPFPNFMSEIELKAREMNPPLTYNNALEVGCGNGIYTDILADNFKTVTALDLSPKMLLELIVHSQSANKSNIKTVCSDFNDFKSDEKFDLVLAALCPGVNTVENITMLESFSKGLCVLITIARDEDSSVLKSLTKKLTNEPLTGLIPDAAVVFNYLYHSGKSPSITIKEMHSHCSSTLEEAIERSKIYYAVFDICSPLHHKIIEDHLTHTSQKGFCEEADSYTIGMIVWKP